MMSRLGFRCQTIEAESIRTEALGRVGAALAWGGTLSRSKRVVDPALQRAERYGQGLPSALNRLGLYTHAPAISRRWNSSPGGRSVLRDELG